MYFFKYQWAYGRIYVYIYMYRFVDVYVYVYAAQICIGPLSRRSIIPSGKGDYARLVVGGGLRKNPSKKAALQKSSFLFNPISIIKEIGMMIIFRQTLGWYYLRSICNMFKHSHSWSDDPQWFCSELRLRLERPATEGIGLPLGRCQASDQKSPKKQACRIILQYVEVF